MHRPSYLLIEENVAGESLDALIRADDKFAESTGTLIHTQHLQQEILIVFRLRCDDYPTFKA